MKLKGFPWKLEACRCRKSKPERPQEVAKRLPKRNNGFIGLPKRSQRAARKHWNNMLYFRNSCVQNSPGLCPRRVRSREIEFWHRPFPFFRFLFWNSCNWNQLKQILIQIRAIIRARTNVTVELSAREAASLGALGHGDSSSFSSWGASVFEAIFGTVFFWKMVPNGTQMALKMSPNLIKNNTWNEVNKTCWKCAKFDILGLARNAFSNRRVAKHH